MVFPVLFHLPAALIRLDRKDGYNGLLVYLAAHVLGLLLLLLGIASAVIILKDRNRPLWRSWWLACTVLIGAALGIAADHAEYMLDPVTKAFGFPLIYLVFQQGEDGLWRDFVGWTTPTFAVCNFLIGLGLPHLVLAAYIIRRTRSVQGSQS